MSAEQNRNTGGDNSPSDKSVRERLDEAFGNIEAQRSESNLNALGVPKVPLPKPRNPENPQK